MPPAFESHPHLTNLADAFWTWRAVTQPVSGDDIPRLERPAGWVPDWSAEAVARQRQQLAKFEAEWQRLGADTHKWSPALQVDYRLVGCALARVRYELDVVAGWRRNPHFYVHQTLGAVFELLLPPPPFMPARAADLVKRAESIPITVDAAMANLQDDAVRPFAAMAIAALQDVRPRMLTVAEELHPWLDPSSAEQFKRAMATGARALEAFAAWLETRQKTMPVETALGRQAYADFLQRVALVPLSPEQVAAAGQQELDRAVAFEALERQRNRYLPPLTLPANQAEQIARAATGEDMLRQFCEAHDLLSFPGWLRHYRNAPLPAYLKPLRGLGVTDDLTSPSRLDEDGICYIPEPTPDLPYFYAAMARDPRTLIAHEGVHYYQLARSWAQPNPIRRHYYDSGPNEGIGFYTEEMLLQAGLFDDSPRSREIIYNFMRLRALRVAVDVRLALGELTIDTAAEVLAHQVPMDLATAREEASFFASEPGQAITYQIGKLQILGFLSAARLAQGDRFNLRAFHDSLVDNGNVPIALQLWETVGAADEMRLLDRASDSLSP